MTSSPEELLTVKEVAALLRVNKATVMNWSKRRELPAVKIGKYWRFRRRDLDAWYESKREPNIAG